MDNFNEKLNAFTALVLKDAEEKRKKLIDQTENEYSKQMEQKENDFLEDAYEDIQKRIRTIRRKANARVIQSEFNAKKSLIKRREEIIEEIFNSVTNEILKFKSEPTYKSWLTDKIDKAIKEVGVGTKEIFALPEDLPFINETIKTYNDNISASSINDTSFIGGIRIINSDKKIAVDYSLKELISAERERFLKSDEFVIT